MSLEDIIRVYEQVQAGQKKAETLPEAGRSVMDEADYRSI
jgi:hypothetical protein